MFREEMSSRLDRNQQVIMAGVCKTAIEEVSQASCQFHLVFG